jgi:hypothetical protein
LSSSVHARCRLGLIGRRPQGFEFRHRELHRLEPTELQDKPADVAQEGNVGIAEAGEVLVKPALSDGAVRGVKPGEQIADHALDSGALLGARHCESLMTPFPRLVVAGFCQVSGRSIWPWRGEGFGERGHAAEGKRPELTSRPVQLLKSDGPAKKPRRVLNAPGLLG